jgi:hypothetical protein
MKPGAYTHTASVILFGNLEQDTGSMTEIPMLY